MWTTSKYWKSLFIFFIEKFAHEWLCLSRKLQDATDVNIADKMAACTGPYVCEAAGAGTQSKHGGSCVHFQESPLAGEPRERLFHIHRDHRYQLCAKYPGHNIFTHLRYCDK